MYKRQGQGPAWSNSLFEDNAEFGLGMRITADHQVAMAERLLQEMATELGEDFVKEILTASQKQESEIAKQRLRVAMLKDKLAAMNGLSLIHI